MKNKAVREIELKAGVNLVVKAEFCHYETEGDVWEGRVAENKSWVKISFDLTLTTTNYHDGFLTHENGRHINHDDMMTINFGRDVVVGLTESNKAKVMDAIESLKAEVTPAGVETEEEKSKREKAESERKHAEYVIAECEKRLEHGALKTRAEAKEYLRNYNNAMNEGGEGFLPKIWTVEDYEEAKAVLGRK
ncbi:MAG: hypothetical protein II584_05070 [Treponema sp.]|nr:hypothetical protein [Treponema sp.]